jgi:choline dehydrogenase-like flavoprotein
MYTSTLVLHSWTLLLFELVLLATPAHAQASNGKNFDYVVVGGGTAGLVVASRLSEDPTVTVAIIEAGDFERNNPNVTNTTTIGIGQGTDLDWQYGSLPQEYVANQSITWRAGKGMGGSSLINGT